MTKITYIDDSGAKVTKDFAKIQRDYRYSTPTFKIKNLDAETIETVNWEKIKEFEVGGFGKPSAIVFSIPDPVKESRQKDSYGYEDSKKNETSGYLEVKHVEPKGIRHTGKYSNTSTSWENIHAIVNQNWWERYYEDEFKNVEFWG